MTSRFSSSFFKLRKCVAFGIFLVATLQNLGLDVTKHTRRQLFMLEKQHEHAASADQQEEAYDDDEDSRMVVVSVPKISSTSKAEYDDDEDTSPTIRRWGCNLQQTPLVYVHIGKSGGGMIRARFAASALEFGANQSWRQAGTAYYPIRRMVGDHGDKHEQEEEGIVQKGYFCNSGNPSFRANGRNTFEGTLFCHATTPLGQAVACPVPLMYKSRRNKSSKNRATSTPNTINAKKIDGCREACDFASDSCHVVYVGHNLLGNEMHWLPQRYLSNWWKNDYLASFPLRYTSYSEQEDKIQAYLQTLAPGDESWCPYMPKSRPSLGNDYEEDTHCSVTLGQVVDNEAFLTVQARHYHPQMTMSNSTTTTRKETLAARVPRHPNDNIDWSHIYASMPVLRTTILREPFSWLVSKYFWHHGPSKCDDVEMATMDFSPFTKDGMPSPRGGWASRFALGYITYLCGEDCAARYDQGIGNLQQTEQQAANNLRQSFAVVGLLHETDTFYDMVTKRVQYVNMSLNPHVKGKLHSSGNGAEQRRCKDKFADASFQALLKQKSPFIAALDRVYKVGVQVNRFQLEELQSCPTTQV